MPTPLSERIQQLLATARSDGLAAVARSAGVTEVDRSVLVIVARLDGDREALAALRAEVAPADPPGRRHYTVRGTGGERS